MSTYSMSGMVLTGIISFNLQDNPYEVGTVIIAHFTDEDSKA